MPFEIVDMCPNVLNGSCTSLDKSCGCTHIYTTRLDECPVCFESKECIEPWKCNHAICGPCFRGPNQPVFVRTCPATEEFGCPSFCLRCAEDELK